MLTGKFEDNAWGNILYHISRDEPSCSPNVGDRCIDESVCCVWTSHIPMNWDVACVRTGVTIYL